MLFSIRIYTICIAILGCLGVMTGYGQSLNSSGNDFIYFIPLPAGISKADLKAANSELRSRLHDYTRSKLNHPGSSAENDLVIVFTDGYGQPILPDVAPRSASSRMSNCELNYTFNSPAQPWNSTQLSSFSTWIGDIYPVIKQVVGNPFFNITVNVRKDSTITASGYFYLALNEVVLRSATAQAFCHESIHAFRDAYIMGISVYEEGLTRAAEIEVFDRLTNYTHPSDEFHGYDYDQYYDALNRPAIGSANGNVTTNITLTALKYNIASYAWAKALIEDNNFIRNFNDSLYERAAIDPNILSSPGALKGIVANIKPVVEGLPVDLWYSRQHIFDMSPPVGYALYQRVNQYVIDYFYRDEYGNETPQSGAQLSWQVFDYAGNLLTSGSGSSSPGYGWVDCHLSFPNYTGRVKIVASVQSPQGLLADTVYRSNQPGASGVFGVVDGANTGIVSVTPLDTLMPTQTASLVNGAFYIASLKNVRGRFRVEFSYPGCGHVSRVFVKDRSSYFVSISNDPTALWVGSIDGSWHNAMNWSGGIVPDDCMDVVLNPGTKFNCVINAPASCRRLTVNPGVVLAVNSDVLVKSQ
jgi:hypothetical protein